MGDAGSVRLPLSALLSQVLVAFTIEADNEFERRAPHRTTNHGRTAGQRSGPWLASMAMWWTCMRFVGEDGITVAALGERARTGTNLRGMQRWGYITVAPDPADSRPKPPSAELVIRATAKGHQAQDVWRSLPGAIEERWRARFGGEAIDGLRQALQAIAGQLDPGLPDCLPILGYGLFSRPPDPKRGRARVASPGATPAPGTTPAPAPDCARPPLPVLLSRVLLAFAVEFEQESPLSLAISADVLRLLSEDGVRVRDLPVLSGVSKEAIAMAMGVLGKQGLVTVGPGPAGGRAPVARLTPAGRIAQNRFHQLAGTVEERWQARYGEAAVGRLRAALEPLAGLPGEVSPLFQGLEPDPGGWRALVRRPAVLPQYPMVLHRGGYPDGS